MNAEHSSIELFGDDTTRDTGVTLRRGDVNVAAAAPHRCGVRRRR